MPNPLPMPMHYRYALTYAKVRSKLGRLVDLLGRLPSGGPQGKVRLDLYRLILDLYLKLPPY